MHETICYAANCASYDLACKYGSYESFEGSQISKGIMHYMHFNAQPSGRWNFEDLKAKVSVRRRNSLLMANMPTATTASVLGNTECFEPISENMFTRKTVFGDTVEINKFLVKRLEELDLWRPDIQDKIIADKGSVQKILEIPEVDREIFKTAWEISMKDRVDMVADAQTWIDQSISFNCYMSEPSKAKLTSFLFYAWEKGLKTLMYYFKTKSTLSGAQITRDPSLAGCSMTGSCGA